jgi:hypothetical protein
LYKQNDLKNYEEIQEKKEGYMLVRAINVYAQKCTITRDSLLSPYKVPPQTLNQRQ